ncbi:hypothetical protein [Amycolatopsis sp. WAC 04197]|uniref:hypothetical protein n=1 Tax=Amycolatopsis sp. WAC 04197 TaxID=2203199 RepID=UPI000F7A012B|nr:hypothetical protein [Amycolatopsis sp. WAC 04197]
MTESKDEASEAPQEDSPTEEAEQLQAAVELSRKAQGAAWVLAVAGILAGGAGVFLTENQVGTAVLFAGGAFFGIIALGGRLPSSIKIGDNEMKMAQALKARAEAQVYKAAAKRVADAPSEEVADLVSSVVNKSTSPHEANDHQRAVHRAATRRMMGINYENLVNAAVSGYAWDRGINVQREVSGGGGNRFDIVLHGNKKIAIEVVAKQVDTELSVLDVERFAHMARQAREHFDAVIFVSNVQLSGTAESFWSQFPESRSDTVHLIIPENDSLVAESLLPAIIGTEEPGRQTERD